LGGGVLKALRILAAVVVGFVVSRIVLEGGYLLLRMTWPAYAAAEPDRTYTFAMLLARLTLFSLMIAVVSATTTLVARDERFPWLVGAIILAVSIPQHLLPGYVWAYYPPWYHLTYLASILPIAVSAGRLVARFVSEPSARTSDA